MNVAHTILRQLGSGRFIAMTGSDNFVTDGNTLRMNLRKNKSKANRLWITLEADDTYTMRFFRYTAPRLSKKTLTFIEEKVTEIETINNVYCDMLQSEFTRVTGMLTRL